MSQLSQVGSEIKAKGSSHQENEHKAARDMKDIIIISNSSQLSTSYDQGQVSQRCVHALAVHRPLSMEFHLISQPPFEAVE